MLRFAEKPQIFLTIHSLPFLTTLPRRSMVLQQPVLPSYGDSERRQSAKSPGFHKDPRKEDTDLRIAGHPLQPIQILLLTKERATAT